MFKPDLTTYPQSPGVYLMMDANGQILYVGKAVRLRSRLRSYFTHGGDGRQQIPLLMRKVARLEVMVTDTEKEALLLENTLIKEHRPRYNIELRDDKTYVSVRMDLREDFPMMQVVRQVKNDGARYFGPYASAAAIRETLRQIYRIFPLRHAPMERCRLRGRPCLFHQIGQCSAPCYGRISREDYRSLVDGVVKLLDGRESEVVSTLREEMLAAAQQREYERAAVLRDQIRLIEQSVEKQKVTDHGGGNQDVVGIHQEGGEVELALLFIRNGKLTGRRTFLLEWVLDLQELLHGFLLEFYSREVLLPDQLLLPFTLEGDATLAEWLSEKRGRKVELVCPQRGEKKRLVDLARRNAAEAYRQRGERKLARANLLQELQQRLKLSALPERIECFDISNIQGQQAVGSMVVLTHGEPDKDEYRRYKIKTVVGADDYASLGEVLRRRLQRGIEENKLPNLILIDGGRGQLGVLSAVLDEFALAETISAVGIAKSRVVANVKGKAVERSEERFFVPGRKNPVVFRQGSAAGFLLERMRDEAHRFAISYHRKLRRKQGLKSSLDQIPGIGPARRRALLKHFGSVKRLGNASIEEIAAVPGFSRKLAEMVMRHLQAGLQ